MADIDEVEMFSIILNGYLLIKKRKKERKCWSKKWLLRRSRLGVSNTLLRELRLENVDDYRRYMRIDPGTFDELHDMIRLKISRMDTNFRNCIPSDTRLELTLRYLATGLKIINLLKDYHSLQYCLCSTINK